MRGHIERRGNRSWRLKWDLGTDPVTGERMTRRKTVTGTKREAETELARILGAIAGGTYVDPNKLTVGAVLIKWRDEVAAVEVSAKTLERYGEHIDRLNAGLGSVLLSRLAPLHVQSLYGELRTRGHRRTGGGLSEQTMLHIHKVLVAALSQAVRWRLIARNPAVDVNPPVPKRLEMMTLDEAQMGRVFRAAEGTSLHLPILLWLSAGLRRGELLGLKWMDLDWERHRLVIVRTLEETKAGLVFKAPKTSRSARIIPLPKAAIEGLRRHEVGQKQQRLAAGPRYQDQGLVFCDKLGLALPPRNVTKAFIALARRAGVVGITIHGLRHTHITQLLRVGVHPKVVSERAGHTSVAFTLQRYGHALPDMQQNAADEAERLVARFVQR